MLARTVDASAIPTAFDVMVFLVSYKACGLEW